MNVKIGSFNCLNFGTASAKKGKGKLIAKVIYDAGFDIIALQEIKGKSVVNDVLRNLNCGNSKGKWRGCADSEVYDYAYIWNSERITLPTTKLDNGEIRVFYPHIYKQYGRDPELGKISLARAPFYGRFQTRLNGIPNIELRLLNTHIRFSKGKDGKECAPKIGEITLRKFEFQALTKNIYYRLSDKVYGKSEGESSPQTAYTILLGDYNLNLSQSTAGSPYLGELECIEIKCKSDEDRTKVIVTTQAELTTLKKPKEEDGEDSDCFANNYDHFTFDKRRFNGTRQTITRINTVTKYYKDPQQHYKELSDHTPINMTLSIKEGR